MQKLVARVKNLLLLPRSEWPVIAAETDTVAGLYTRYVLILAALPALAGFIKMSLIGTGALGITVRTGISAGLGSALMQYVLSLVGVYLLAMIVNALAPTFSAQKDSIQALKVTAYAYTASWVAGVAIILPWVGALLMIAGGIYSIYLLYLGLPATMRCPPDKAVAYTAVSVICAIVIGVVIGTVAAGISGIGATRLMSSSDGNTISVRSKDREVTIDRDSALGKLQSMAEKLEAAGSKMEEAQKSGDSAGQQAALGEMMGTMFGGGETVEALSPEQIKPFVPETLGGLDRGSYNVERNTVLGFQVSSGKADYRDESGERSLNFELTDMGSARGFAALAGWALVESESESDSGYERSYESEGMRVHEKWDEPSHSGSYELIVAERFLVKLQGSGLAMDDIKSAAASLNLAGLAELKNQGVQTVDAE